jgi:hypothetical protein
MIREVIEDGRGMKHFDTASQLIELFGAEMALNAALELIAPKKQPELPQLSKEPPVVVKIKKKNDFPRKHDRMPMNKRERFGDKKVQKRSKTASFKNKK